MIFRQLQDQVSNTFTYFLADEKTKEGVVIDPVLENVERDFQLINHLGIKLLWILDTHVHADHITGSSMLKLKTGAKTGLGKATQVACVDHLFAEGEKIIFGQHLLQVIATPGHTNGCTTYYLDRDCVFTGDTLLIQGCGRTDFQEGSSEKLFSSVHDKLFILPDHVVVYPGHDYAGRTQSTIGEEKKSNPRLKTGTTLAQFVEIMKNLKLDYPKQMDRALPANLSCGRI